MERARALMALFELLGLAPVLRGGANRDDAAGECDGDPNGEESAARVEEVGAPPDKGGTPEKMLIMRPGVAYAVTGLLGTSEAVRLVSERLRRIPHTRAYLTKQGGKCHRTRWTSTVESYPYPACFVSMVHQKLGRHHEAWSSRALREVEGSYTACAL